MGAMPDEHSSRQTHAVENRRRDSQMVLITWGILVVVGIVFTIATAGVGAFFLGIVVIGGLVLAALSAGKRS